VGREIAFGELLLELVDIHFGIFAGDVGGVCGVIGAVQLVKKHGPDLLTGMIKIIKIRDCTHYNLYNLSASLSPSLAVAAANSPSARSTPPSLQLNTHFLQLKHAAGEEAGHASPTRGGPPKAKIQDSR
jgi:hypothetical protein